MITIDMTRCEGPKGVALVECANRRKQMYIVRTDVQNAPKEDASDAVTFIQHVFDHRPTIDEVKEFVIGVIDAKTDARILNGYEFSPDGADEPIVVWLSRESQTNFSEAQRLGIVPVTFKMNEDANKNAIYHTFDNFDELDRFYKGGVAYIQQQLVAGWQEKDNIEWEPYINALNEAVGDV